MHFSNALLLLLPVIASAAPLANPSLDERAIGAAAFQAAQTWQTDTNSVSHFLEKAATMSGAALTTAAIAAFNSESNEIAQKNTIDAVLTNSVITAASNKLGNGSFQKVLGFLQSLSTPGMTTADIQKAVANVNSVRCCTVLPAIDDYFSQVAAQGTQNFFLTAIRPNNCPANCQ